jgi:leucyl aminopeptidase
MPQAIYPPTSGEQPLGPDLPALFTRRDETADQLLAAGKAHDDAVWRLPLERSYAEWLKSDIADTGNAHGNAYAGASVAALFLDKFVGDGVDWAPYPSRRASRRAAAGRGPSSGRAAMAAS